MEKQTILNATETAEITTYLKMLESRVLKEESPKCNIDLLQQYIKNLSRTT